MSIPPRSRTCANSVSDRMPYAVGRLYVEKNFDPASKQAVIKFLLDLYIFYAKQNLILTTKNNERL